MSQLSYYSPAKTNLFLWVGEKRPDNYHEVRTVMAPLEICDELTAVEESEFKFEIEGSELHADENNFVVKAVRAFARAAKVSVRLRLVLKKRLPIGAGLGGGSSNAATALKLLNEWFAQPLSNNDMHALCTQIGSDVPFFMQNRASYFKGRGEVFVRAVAILETPAVVIYPRYKISTAEVYQQLYKGSRAGAEVVQFWDSAADVSLLQSYRYLHNDLEECVAKKYPGISVCLGLLAGNGAVSAFMTGSGSAVCGIFSSSDEAERAAAQISAEHEHLYVQSTRILPEFPQAMSK